jgi:two-component system response regulator ResD
MQGLTILIADDDPNVRELVRIYFGREGATVLTAVDGAEAVTLLAEQSVGVVILDVMMPEQDGFSVCRELRRTSDIPVLMLTAKGEEIDRVLGLELGADDYIVKPFSPRELVARVKAILRRTRSQVHTREADAQGSLAFPGLTVDLRGRTVQAAGLQVPLAPKEFDLLAFLAQHPRTVLEREQILTRVWGYDFAGDTRTVDVHVKKLRLKLGEPVRRYLHTVWGIGYKFEVTHVGDD